MLNFVLNFLSEASGDDPGWIWDCRWNAVILRQKEQGTITCRMIEVSPVCFPQHHQVCNVLAGHICYAVLVLNSKVSPFHCLFSKRINFYSKNILPFT